MNSATKNQQKRIAALIGLSFKHVKTDRVYVVMGHCMIEKTYEVGVLYMIADNSSDTLWVRGYDNFFDGRFIQQ